MKITTVRKLTLSLVMVVAVAGLIFDTGTGTLSSLGYKAIAAICPLGVVETFLATWTFIPRVVVVLVLCIVLAVVLGKFFCAWLCPVPPLRRFLSPPKVQKTDGELEASAPALPTKTEKTATEPALAPLSDDEKTELAKKSGCTAECSSCAEKRKKFDSRHLVLGGALVSTAIFGFPVFCIVCPVGLTFASIIAFWRLVGFNEPSWALLLFPALLLVELLVLRKWCTKFCPMGALFSLMSLPNRFFRPKVDESKFLRFQGKNCTVCVDSCAENLDPHFAEGMHECTKCGLCKENCPAGAISIPFKGPKQPIELTQDGSPTS
jgi:ferredoxin-type protein NapH